jgi:hypothetical protein
MKKLLVLLFVAVFASCSQEQVESVNSIAEPSLSVLDGKILSYKDEASFIKEYSKISEYKTKKDVQNWISKKGHSSMLNSVELNENYNDSIFDNTKIIYSDALKAIFNADSKVKINGEVVWLNERNLFRLTTIFKDKNSKELTSLRNSLEIYGNILGSLPQKSPDRSLASRIVPNSNRSMDWSKYYRAGGRDRRIILTLYNETIVLNGFINSSKMFLRCVKQGKYCSVWKCRWNDDSDSKNISVYVAFDPANYEWTSGVNQNYYGINGVFSSLISDLNINNGTADYKNYSLYGSVSVEVDGLPAWFQQLSWY